MTTRPARDVARSAGSRRRGPVPTPNALDLIRTNFAVLVAEPRPLSIDGRAFGGLPDATLPLSQVRDRLLAGGCPQATRDAVWAHLVTRARTSGGDWTIGAAGVGLPALTAIAARLTSRFAADPSDIHAEIVSGFLAALTTVDVTRPRIMVRLRWAAYRAGHRALIEAMDAPWPAPSTTDCSPMVRPSGHPDLVLARAIGDQVISEVEAELIGATRIEGVSVAEWAAARGVSAWAIYKMRKRAELRLVGYLLDGEVGPRVRTAAGRPASRAAVTDARPERSVA